jgi:glutamate racemase
MRIGFFDSGIGGITVLHQTLKFLPKEDYLYYADTLHVPYGEKTKEEVKGYIFSAVDFIAKQNIKALVIACNTATSIVIEELRKQYNFPILGIEPAVKPAIELLVGSLKKVLVLATTLTLNEKKYYDLVHRLGQGEIIDSLSLPGLVQFAESFEFNEKKVIPYLEKELSLIDLQQYGTVVLGCTHFPYFEDALRKVFPEDVAFISGSIGTAKNLKRILESKDQVNQGTGDIIFFKSGVKIEDTSTLSSYRSLFRILDEF